MVQDPAARLLVVEDDATLRAAVARALRGERYAVRALADGVDLRSVTEEFRPDLAILDVGLPAGPDGFALARELRELRAVSILFLTAADGLDDRLRGFEVGGDDYVVKPFALAELLARVRAVLRRSGTLASPTWEIRDLVVDEADRAAVRAGTRLDLTGTEFDLLCALGRRPGTVVSKVQLLSLVWGFDEYDPNLVEVHVSALRRKLEASGPRLIHTVRGAGYVMRS